MSADNDEHVTVGDLDIDVEEELDDDHPFEVDTRAGGVVMVPEETIRFPERISVEAALALADTLQYAADHAAEYNREQAAENGEVDD